MKKIIFYLSTVLILTSLSCSSDDNGDSGGENNPTADYYYKATIDGRDELIQIDDRLTQMGGTNSESGAGVCRKSYSAFIGDFFTDFKPILSITFNRMFEANKDCLQARSEEESAFGGLFQSGAYEYLVDGMDNPRHIQIEYEDTSGEIWRSDLGTQIGTSNFEIVSSEVVDVSNIFPSTLIAVKVKGRLSCRLYDDQNQTIDLTNGEFSYLYFFE